jgi:ATP-dependent DNA helicase RecQ
VLRSMSPEQRLGWLVAHLDSLPGSGIVYTLTVSAAEDVAAALAEAGQPVAAYTGRTDPADRERLEEALRRNEVKALVATSALGMGFDKPDLGFVVHLGAPSSPVAYYQQVGRAGRATERADVLLLPGPEDRDIWQYFASVSMPREDQADAVLRALAEAGRPLSTAALETAVDVRRTRLELLLKVLDVDGAVQRVSGGWVTTGVPWRYDAERYERVAAARADEQQLMVEYERTDGCRMAFLQETLDDATAEPCGRCDGCAGPWYPTDVPDRVVGAARERLARVGVPVDPRAQWPTGMDRVGVPVKGRIPAEESVLPGRALARLSDLGWGSRLRDLLREDSPASAQLLRACVPVLAEWGWADRPVGVVATPSRGHPQLVASLAAGLAEIGRLPLLGTLDLAHGGPTGEMGGNSAYRLAGVWDRLVVGADLAAALEATSGPVLLVDDVVSTRWTMTVAGRALRLAGARGVLPFALAVDG